MIESPSRKKNIVTAGVKPLKESMNQERSFWSREVSEQLKIGSSTLRKWCGILEQHGYTFARDDQERRAFTDHDLDALRHFKELTQDKGMALDNAAQLIVEHFKRTALQPITPSATPQTARYDGAIDQLIERMAKQEEFNEALLRRLDDQQRHIEESLNRRDEMLMTHIRETLAARKQIAAEIEERSLIGRIKAAVRILANKQP